MPEQEISAEEMVARSASGAAKTALIGLFGRAAGLLVTLLVTHFVSKAEYGNANLAMIVATVVNMLTLLSPQQALLTRHEGYDRAAGVVHTFAALSGVAVGAILWLLSPRIVALLGQPEAALLLRVYCAALVLERVGVIPILGLRYRLRFGEVARVDFVSDMAYVVVTLVSGHFGAGGLCLALGMVARQGSKLVVLAALRVRVLPPLPRFHAEGRRIFAEVMQKAWPIHLGGGAEFLTLYLDNVFVGSYYGAAAEGLYAVGYTMVMTPADTIAIYVCTAMVRALGLRDEAVRRRTYLSGLRYVAFLLFPIGAGASLCARTLEVSLLPERWHGIAPIMVGLMAGAMTMGIMRMAFVHLTGIHRMRSAALMDVVRLVLFLLALFVVSRIDPLGAHLPWVGWAVAAAFAASSAIGLLMSLSADGIPVRAALSALWPATAATGFMSAVVGGLLLFSRGRGLASSPLWLAALVAAGAASYIGYLRLMHREMYDEAAGWARNRVRRD